MKRKYLNYFGVLVLIAILIGISIPVWIFPLFSNSHKKFTISQGMEQEFLSLYKENADVNKGVTIQLLSFYDNEADTQAGIFFDMAILNHTDEPIVFPNAAYGLRIFTPDEIILEWIEVIPNFPLGDDATLLMPKTESYGPNTNNSFFMPYVAFDADIPNKLRISVFGIGQITNKTYIAFVDVSRGE